MATPHTQAQQAHAGSTNKINCRLVVERVAAEKHLEKMHCALTGTAHSVNVLNNPPKKPSFKEIAKHLGSLLVSDLETLPQILRVLCDI